MAGLAGACAIGVALRVANFAAVPTTPFYDAAIRSMGLSLHNLFYGALDPGGQLSADKPPLDLWLQVASTKVIGFSSEALRLPQVVAGIVAIPLLYDVVRRGFGRGAGVAAALAFAVLPATVLTSRSDTMDTVMATLLVLAAWLIVRAAPERRARAVVAAGAVAGLAFEVKLTEATVALPALAMMAWIALDAPKDDKARTLAYAGVAFVAAAAWCRDRVAAAWQTSVRVRIERRLDLEGHPDLQRRLPAGQPADIRHDAGSAAPLRCVGAQALRQADRHRAAVRARRSGAGRDTCLAASAHAPGR